MQHFARTCRGGGDRDDVHVVRTQRRRHHGPAQVRHRVSWIHSYRARGHRGPVQVGHEAITDPLR